MRIIRIKFKVKTPAAVGGWRTPGWQEEYPNQWSAQFGWIIIIIMGQGHITTLISESLLQRREASLQ